MPEGSLLYICGDEIIKIGNGSFSGINLYVMAENKQNLNHVEILSQGTFRPLKSVVSSSIATQCL